MKKICKNSLIIIILSILIVLLIGLRVQAAEPTIQLIGENTIKSSQQILTIKITSDEEIGVIEGYITGNENVESIETGSSYNGWTINYNKESGKFNAFNAVGTKNGEVLQIKYTIKKNDENLKITLSNIKLTTISYNTIEISESIEKEVTTNNAVLPSESIPETTPVQDSSKNEFENKNNESKQNETEMNETLSSTKQSKTAESTTKTTSALTLPKAGISYLIAMIILTISLVGGFFYIRYSGLKKNMK